MSKLKTRIESLADDEPEAQAFTQTAHSLVPANTKSLMSVDNVHQKRAIVPISAADVTRAYSYPVTFTGGAYGDETLSTANATDPYSPKTLTEYMALPGSPASAVPTDPDYVSSVVVNTPKGWIDPQEPYGPAPVSPTDDPVITSLTPNTGVSGGSPIWVTITGSKFTPYSSVLTGGVYTPYSRYISPTKMAMLQDPRSTPGIVTVQVQDHGVNSAPADFTFT